MISPQYYKNYDTSLSPTHASAAMSLKQCFGNGQWVSGNSPWTPLECTWMPMSEWEHSLSAHERHWVIIEHDSPWCDHEKDLICVRTEHTLNACECTWMSMSEYWTCPECLWVRMNVKEWVGTSPEHPLSAHECLWVSIWKVWMHTSRVVNLKKL